MSTNTKDNHDVLRIFGAGSEIVNGDYVYTEAKLVTTASSHKNRRFKPNFHWYRVTEDGKIIRVYKISKLPLFNIFQPVWVITYEQNEYPHIFYRTDPEHNTPNEYFGTWKCVSGSDPVPTCCFSS